MPAEKTDTIAELSGGANQARVRVHNERLVLSLVRRHAGLSKAEIARRTGLSAQTVTVIMRALEEDGLLMRGAPVRGKVGQPSIPMMLDPDGAFSLGLKIGRRSIDLILMDFTGDIRGRLRETYTVPRPENILRFVAESAGKLINLLPREQQQRVAGLGVATPFELWNWADTMKVPKSEMDAWRDFDIAAEIADATGLPVLVQNDGTAACGAELLFGRGRESANFAYFFVGYFVGGGIVMDSSLVSGPSGNAGAFGTIRVGAPEGPVSLLDCASLHVLENAISDGGMSPAVMWESPDSWAALGSQVDTWAETSAGYLAQAMLSVCSVFDFETVIIDGNLPADVRSALVSRTERDFAQADLAGITVPAIVEGSLGHDAQVIGGASLPIMARYLVDNAVLFKQPAG